MVVNGTNPSRVGTYWEVSEKDESAVTPVTKKALAVVALVKGTGLQLSVPVPV